MKPLVKFLRSQKGFTLVELVAVMAIMAILVAIVAPAVVDTRDTSIRAQAQGDAKQVNNLAAEYYGDQNESEVRTPHTTAVGAIGVKTAVVGTDPQQEISSRWPERFITNTDTTIDSASTRSKSSYRVEFEPTATATKVVLVTLLRANNTTPVTAADFLTRFTAVDFAKLGGDTPSSATLVTEVVGIEVHNFLWLFEKGSSGSGLDDDVRTAAVFQLTGTEINEAGGSTTVNLTYKQILGSVVSAVVSTGRATGTLAFAAAPAERSSVTIGTITYTFVDLLCELSWETSVLWGPNAIAALSDCSTRATPSATSARDNLIAAINGAPGGSGVIYGTLITAPHPSVTAAAGPTGNTVVVTAKTPGTAGNSIITTTAPGMMPDRVTGVTTANPGFTWGAATLTGGTD